MQFSKTRPLKSGESSENPVEKIVSNPVTSAAVMVFSALITEVSDFHKLGGRFGYFLFFWSGRGNGESEVPEGGGVSVLIAKSQEWKGFQEGEGPRGWEGVCGELGNFWRGGLHFFFSGPKCPPSKSVAFLWMLLVSPGKSAPFSPIDPRLGHFLVWLPGQVPNQHHP